MIPAARLTRTPPRDPARETYGPFPDLHAAADWAWAVQLDAWPAPVRAAVVDGTGLALREPFEVAGEEAPGDWEVGA